MIKWSPTSVPALKMWHCARFSPDYVRHSLPVLSAGKGGSVKDRGTCQLRWYGLCSSVWFYFPQRDFYRSNFKKPSQQLTESSLFIQIEGLLSSPRLCDSTCIFEGFTLLLMPLYPTMKAVIFRKLWGGSG